MAKVASEVGTSWFTAHAPSLHQHVFEETLAEEKLSFAQFWAHSPALDLVGMISKCCFSKSTRGARPTFCKSSILPPRISCSAYDTHSGNANAYLHALGMTRLFRHSEVIQAVEEPKEPRHRRVALRPKRFGGTVNTMSKE
ncbi:UNVERIFIED_CONTAM: hypothetical protein K2H54_034772, partial [Gekko kuhli]